MAGAVRLRIAVVLTLFVIPAAWSQTEPEGSLEEEFAFLEAEDIEKIPLTVVSRGGAIPAGQAPAVVDVITSEEIRLSGARTLAELLSQRVGIDVSLDRLVPRGLNTSFAFGAPIFNHRTLLLIDGRPTNSVFFGEFLAGRELPLDHIARIEVIRGPGSALYGTNAEAGVINVVTKDAADMPRIGTTAEYGRFNTRRVDAFGGIGGPRRNVSFFLRYFGSDGADQINENDDQDQLFAFLRGTLGPVTLEAEALTFRQETSGTEDNPTPNDRVNRDRYSITASLAQPLGRQFTLNGKAYANLYQDRFIVEASNPDRSVYDERRFGQELSLTYRPSDWFSVTLGGEVREEGGEVGPFRCRDDGSSDEADLDPNGCDLDQTVYAGFVEDQIQLRDDLVLTAGARYDRVSTSGDRISPRVHLFWQARPVTSFKVGYGEAFRAPSFFERRGAQVFGDDTLVIGNPNLDREIVRTVEGEFHHRVERSLNVRLSAFHTMGDDLITQTTEDQLVTLGVCPPFEDDDPGLLNEVLCPLIGRQLQVIDQTSFVNAERVHVTGLEAAFGGVADLPIPGEFRYGVNYTFQNTTNETLDGNELPLAPPHKVNLLVDYRPIRDLSLFWHMRWLDSQFADADNDVKLDPLFNHNLNAIYRISRSFEASLGLYNALDSDDREAQGVPREPLTVLGAIRYRFAVPPPVPSGPPPPAQEPVELAEARGAVEQARAAGAARMGLRSYKEAVAHLRIAEELQLKAAGRERVVAAAGRALEKAREARRKALAREAAPTPSPSPAPSPTPALEPTPKATPEAVETPEVRPSPEAGPPAPTPTPEAPVPPPAPPATREPSPTPEPTPTPTPDLSERRVLLLQSNDEVTVYREAALALLRDLPGRVELKDLRGDREQAIDALRAEGGQADLIVAVGSVAASVAREEVTDRPVIFCAALNPERYDLSAPNMGGVSFELSAVDQLRRLKEVLPSVQRIGVIYNPEVSGAFVQEAQRAASSFGIRLVTAVAQDPRDVGFVFRSLREEVDLLWMVPDPTVLTRESFEVLRLQTAEAGIPFVSYAEMFARKGALLAFYPDPGNVGSQCADLATRVLAGEVSPGEIGVRSPNQYRVAVNRRIEELLGVDVSPSLQADVEIR